jgi:hypothetical protein
VRALYHSFRDAKLEIASGSTCRCGACDRSEDLSLKFVVHRGEYDVQNIAGRKELIGPDIVLATRLLKNSVPVREYVIATEAARELTDGTGVEAAPGEDHLEGIGPVRYTYVDLGPVAAEYEQARGFHLSEAEARLTVAAEIEAPVETVWAAMTELQKRSVWQVTIKQMMHLQGPPGKVGEVSHIATPIFVHLMKSDIRKDMAGLKELCETGKVAGREAALVG